MRRAERLRYFGNHAVTWLRFLLAAGNSADGVAFLSQQGAHNNVKANT